MLTLDELRLARQTDIIASLSSQINHYKSQDMIYRAWLFGSYSKNTWNGLSDVDILCVSNRENHQIPLVYGSKVIDIVVIDEQKLNSANKNPYLSDILRYGIEL